MDNVKGSNEGIIEEVDNTITIDDLIVQLDVFTKWEKLTQYSITEDFDKVGRHTYNLHNLEASIVKIGNDKVVMFDDVDHIIREDLKRVLGMFPLRKLVKIEHCWDTSYKSLLVFNDGTVLIERIKK